MQSLMRRDGTHPTSYCAESFLCISSTPFSVSLSCSAFQYLFYSAREEEKVGRGAPVNAAKLRHDLTNHEDF